MAKQVSVEGNILKIDNGVSITYLNAGWCNMRFEPVLESTEVIIMDAGSERLERILFTEFQDGTSTPYTTEAAIATYLSNKIG